MKLFNVHRRTKNSIFKHCLQPLAAIGVILKILEQVKTFIRGFFKFRFPPSSHLKIQASKNEEREGGREEKEREGRREEGELGNWGNREGVGKAWHISQV